VPTPDGCTAGTPVPAKSADENVKRRDSADSTSSRQAIPPHSQDHPSAAVKKTMTGKKSAPLKSLGALDALLRKS